MSFMRLQSLLLLVLSAALAMTGCKKAMNTPAPGSNPNPPPAATLSISGIKPATGAYNTGVTITGTGFSSTMTDDSVFINGNVASIVSANDSQIVVTVPKYAGTGDIAVKVAGVEKTGLLFTYIWTALGNRYAGAGNNDVFTGSYLDGPAATAGFWILGGLALDNS